MLTNDGMRNQIYESEKKFIYEICLNGFSEEKISEQVKIIRDIIKNDSDIVDETNPNDHTYQVVRVRCTWSTFEEIKFRLDLQHQVFWI